MSFPSSRRRSALTAIAHAAALLAAGAMTAQAQETNTQSSEGLQVVSVTAQ